MRRYELGMTLNYARNWEVADAIREFIQNALDEEKVCKGNDAKISYKDGTVTVSNKKSRLKMSSLLLGSTTKDKDKNLIGEHGEGYKVATVVLMRNGCTVKIHNNESKEVWTSKVVHSRRYDTDIVVFDIDKSLIKRDSDLVIEIEGVSEDDWHKVVENTLFLRDDYETSERLEGSIGEVLLDDRFKGMVYVEGLFVCKVEDLERGYNFKAGTLKLDRDRGLVDNYDLKSAIADLVLSTNNTDYIKENRNSSDFFFVSARISNGCIGESLCESVIDSVYEDFRSEYGDDAYPVKDTDTFNSMKKKGVNAVMVSSSDYDYLKCKGEISTKSCDVLTIDDEFELWYKDVCYLLGTESRAKIRSLWERARGRKCE